MKPFYILGTVAEVEERTKTDPDPSIAGNGPSEKDSGRKLYFTGCRDVVIGDKTYVCAPLSEIAALFHLQEADFMENELLDAICKIKRQIGYSPIINV